MHPTEPKDLPDAQTVPLTPKPATKPPGSSYPTKSKWFLSLRMLLTSGAKGKSTGYKKTLVFSLFQFFPI